MKNKQQQQPQTPEDRIAAMRATVQARKDREAVERNRQALRKQAAYQAGAMLMAALEVLDGLPLSPYGEVQVLHQEQHSESPVRVYRKYDNRDYADYDLLIAFGVGIGEDLVEGEEFEWWPTHDGERVSGEVALDLATAAVEARFHCE